MVKALVVTGFGINCNDETAYAFERAGAQSRQVHLNDLIERPQMLDDFQILAVPGGFSFGDDIASGRIFANRLRYRLGDAIEGFVDKGNLVIGVCNGFQVLVKMGLLPHTRGKLEQEVTLTHNDSNRYEDRWVKLEVEPDTHCVWLRGIKELEVPVRHGEGKFLAASEEQIAELKSKGLAPVYYAAPQGGPAGGEFPHNPNGSAADIAGLTDPTGRIFGLMPHPEAFLDRTNHPRWTREDLPEEGAGLAMFRNAVAYLN